MKTSSTLLSFLIYASAASLLAGCGDSKGAGETAEPTQGSNSNSNSNSNTDSESQTATTNDPTVGPTTDPTGTETGGMTSTTAGSDPMTSGTTDCNFICNPDGMGGGNTCDIWAQDCPDGEKCQPYDSDGDSAWDSTHCTALDAAPKQDGDECIAEPINTGGDNCDVGLLCWFVNEESMGTCLNMCTGSMESPQCNPGEVCDISNQGSLILCLDTCDPVAVDCPDGQICFPTSTDDGQFICDFDASGDLGAFGDPCEFINVCDPGLFCAAADFVPGCDAAGCCTPFCDLNSPACPMTDPPVECVKWHEPGQEPPGLEHVGVCILPE